MQPTPARSPTLNFVTPSPTRVTRPMISWPGTIGNVALPHSSRAWWTSEWHTPQKRISIWTSPGRGSRRSTVNGASGARAAGAA